MVDIDRIPRCSNAAAAALPRRRRLLGIAFTFEQIDSIMIDHSVPLRGIPHRSTEHSWQSI
jgi:hypothetical protein